MVTRNCFRLIIYISFFFSISGILVSEDKMSNIELNINDAYSKYKLKKLKIIDIRTIKEWKITGTIPESFLINMHNEDYSENHNFLEEVKKIVDLNKDTDVAFICASGARSEIVVNYFREKKYHNTFHIPEGILGKDRDGWLYLGFPIENYIEQ